MGLFILQDKHISERLLLSIAFFLFGLLSKNNTTFKKIYQLFLTTLPQNQRRIPKRYGFIEAHLSGS
jgi:hypothetical protein